MMRGCTNAGGLLRQSASLSGNRFTPKFLWMTKPVVGMVHANDMRFNINPRFFNQPHLAPFLQNPSKLPRYDDPIVNEALATVYPAHPKLKFFNAPTLWSSLSWVSFRGYKPWFLNAHGLWWGYLKFMMVSLIFIWVVSYCIIDTFFVQRIGAYTFPSHDQSIQYGAVRMTHETEWRLHLHKLGFPLVWRWWDDVWTPWDLKEKLRAEFGEPIPEEKRTRFPQGEEDPFNHIKPIWEHKTRPALSPRELGVELVLPDKRGIKPHPLLGPGGIDNIMGRNEGLHPAHNARLGVSRRTAEDSLQ